MTTAAARRPARPPHVPPTPAKPTLARYPADAVYDTLEDRLDEAGEAFEGYVLTVRRWALLCELLLPERFKAPPHDPRPIPPMVAGDPECRVLVMMDRAHEGYTVFSPGDARKPDWADGTRGLTAGGTDLAPGQAARLPKPRPRTDGTAGR